MMMTRSYFSITDYYCFRFEI